jgi:hypothetical protein
MSTMRRIQVSSVPKASAASSPVWRHEAVERMLRIACHRGGLVRLAEVDPDIEVVLTVDGAEEAVLRNLRPPSSVAISSAALRRSGRGPSGLKVLLRLKFVGRETMTLIRMRPGRSCATGPCTSPR